MDCPRSELMQRFLLTGFLLLLPACQMASAQNGQPVAAKPRVKLAVLLVFDQLRADYLTQHKALFGPGGFNRLLDKGAWFQEAHYPYAITVTGAGHASLATGCTPRVHGILANDWCDRTSGAEIYCATTERQKNIPPSPPTLSSRGTIRTGGGSPERLQVATVGDLLRQKSPGSRVAGFSLKDRGAVLPAGKMGTCVYYWDSATGLFGTSTFYRDSLAPWVADFNGNHPADKWFNTTWEKLRPDLDYEKLAGPDNVTGEGPGIDRRQGRTFPHPFPTRSLTGKPDKMYYNALYNSPFSNEILADITLRAISEEKLGQRAETDFLSVSFSANDVVGHCWGPDSQEVLDTLLRSDAILTRLFAELDHQVGKDNWMAVLSADHGVSPLPEVAQARGDTTAVRIDEATLFKNLCAHLTGKFSLEPTDRPFFNLLDENMYLNHGTFAKKGVALATAAQAAAEYLEKQPGILRAYTRARLEGLKKPDTIDLMMLESYSPAASGDLLIVLAPGCLIGSSLNATGTSHGTPHRYDTHIPLLATGPGVRPGVRAGKVSVLAAAAILAEAMGVAPLPQAEALPLGLFDER